MKVVIFEVEKGRKLLWDLVLKAERKSEFGEENWREKIV